MKDLVDSKAAVTDSSDGQENGIKAFQEGKVAMIIDGPWDIALAREGEEFKGGKKDNLGVAPVPVEAVRRRGLRRVAGTSPSTPGPSGCVRRRNSRST